MDEASRGNGESRAITRFEDLIAWQKARELTRVVYGLTRIHPMSRDPGLSSQVQRAAVSVMSNIAEGYERKGQVEFSRFLTIAKASCAEVLSLLYVALDVGYIDQATFDQTKKSTLEVSRIVGGLRDAVDRRIADEKLVRTRKSII